MRASAAQMVTAWETQREGLSQTGRKEPWALGRTPALQAGPELLDACSVIT